MATEFITSTGQCGADFNRSEGRAYLTVEQPVDNANSFSLLVADFRSESLQVGRRRWVVKARCTPEVVKTLAKNGLPIEARVPLSFIDTTTEDEVVILGENIHSSDTPEWGQVYDYWRRENGNFSILNRLQRVREQGFSLTDQVSEDNIEDLATIWRPFGWDEQSVVAFIRDHSSNHNLWFSGMLDQKSQRLVAACMGERLDFAGVVWCESTEYGTAKDFRGRGLCTAAVINLNAQILSDTLYKNGIMPLVVAELNMSARSDVVARHTGMTIPFVDQVSGLEGRPQQVLRRNVAILDGEPVDLDLSKLDGSLGHFREAFGNNFKYWRNFIVGILSKEEIDRYYSLEQCQEILNHYG